MGNKVISRRNFMRKSSMAVAGTALLPSPLNLKKAQAASSPTNKMFCYQCEQTMDGKGCTSIGACGKTSDVADLQDLLIYSLRLSSPWEPPPFTVSRASITIQA